MQFRFSFKHMESSAALESYARDKIKKEVEKFVTKAIEVHVNFSVDKHEHHVLCILSGGDGFKVTVEHACDDMYGSIDHMIDKLVTQLQRKKEKLKDHKHAKAREPFADVGDQGGTIDASDILEYEQTLVRRRV